MNTLREIEEHFQYLPHEMLDVLIELRNLVARIAPDATEVIPPQRNYLLPCGPRRTGQCGRLPDPGTGRPY